jgi:signal transduction histidine kinase
MRNALYSTDLIEAAIALRLSHRENRTLGCIRGVENRSSRAAMYAQTAIYEVRRVAHDLRKLRERRRTASKVLRTGCFPAEP